MRRLATLAIAATLTACTTSDNATPAGALPTQYQSGLCFRASEITNYNVEAPHAAFVLTSRGYVYGLISENCFHNGADTFSVNRSNLNDGWMCSGDTIALRVHEWRGRGYPCLARITQPLDDPALSGFRSRARPPA